MSPSKKTPRNDQEFLDYRLNQTEEKIDQVAKKVDQVIENTSLFATQSQLDGLKHYVDDTFKAYLPRTEWQPFKVVLLFIAVAVGGAIMTYALSKFGASQ